MPEEENINENESELEPEKPGNKKLLFAGLAFLLLLGMGGLGWFFLSSQAAAEEEENPEGEPEVTAFIHLENFVVNLADLLGEQASMTSPVLLCSSPARFHLRRLLEPFLPRVVVLSPAEIPTLVSVQSMGMVG